MRLITGLIVAAACAPSMAYAGVYKCQQANGAFAYQDQPCPNAAAGTSIQVKPASGYAASETGVASPRPVTAEEAAKYPYARPGDIDELHARAAKVRAMAEKLKADNPDWERSERDSRLIKQAEALAHQIDGGAQ